MLFYAHSQLRLYSLKINKTWALPSKISSLVWQWSTKRIKIAAKPATSWVVRKSISDREMPKPGLRNP